MVNFDWGTLSLSFPQAEEKIKKEMLEFIKAPSESTLLDKLDRAKDSANAEEFNAVINKLFNEVSRIQLKSLLEEDKNSYSKLTKNNEQVVRILNNFPLSDLLKYRKLDRLTGKGAIRAQTSDKVEPFNSERLYRSWDFNPTQMQGEVEFNMRLERTSGKELSYTIKPSTNFIYTPDPKTETFIIDEKREHLENTTNVPPTYISDITKYSLTPILMDFPINYQLNSSASIIHLDKATKNNMAKPFEEQLVDQFIKTVKSLEERYIYPLQNDPTVAYSFSATGEIKNKTAQAKTLTARMSKETGYTASGEKEKERDYLFEIIRFFPDGRDEEGNPKFRKESEALDFTTAALLENTAFTNIDTQEKISITAYQRLSDEEKLKYRPSFIFSKGEGASSELIQSYAENPLLKPLTEEEEKEFLNDFEVANEEIKDITDMGKTKYKKQKVKADDLEQSLEDANLLVTLTVKQLGRFRLGRFKRNLSEGMEDKIYRYKSRFFSLKKKVGA